jgi:hypothetical protein
MKCYNLIAIYAGLLAFAQASSSSSESSDKSLSLSPVDGNIQPDCLECPNPHKSHKLRKSCGRKRILYLTDRTCYTCPKFKCVKEKYFKEGQGKVCSKIMPTCRGRCKRSQTCFITVQTRYSCPKAKCISRFLNRNRLEDYCITKRNK